MVHANPRQRQSSGGWGGLRAHATDMYARQHTLRRLNYVGVVSARCMVYIWGYESRHGRAACVSGAARRVPPSSNKNRSRFAPPSRRVVTSTRFKNSLCNKPTVCMRGMRCTAAHGKMLRVYTHDSGWHRQACMHVILRHRPQYNTRRSENLDRGSWLHTSSTSRLSLGARQPWVLYGRAGHSEGVANLQNSSIVPKVHTFEWCFQAFWAGL